ncbi:hypothetical protein QQF64_018489 [Cirrhinus molitorella]|uniref:C1q domain-containing protein n=1 Tax=Cirrhinus molitorella TaxID=172907 RepID=A0ABR3LCV5_9TELE
MKSLVCILLLLETFVFAVQQQLDGGLSENVRAETSTDSKQNCQLCFPDIHAALRELTTIVTEQKANIRALETRLKEQQTFILKELNKKNEEVSNLTLSQVEKLRKENKDSQIAFSAALMQSGGGHTGPFTTDITLTYKNVFTNIGNAYNPISGIFTAPLKGAYMFRISLYGSGSQSTLSTVSIVKNGERVVVAHGNQAGGVVNSSNGVVFLLEVGDIVYVSLWSGAWIYDNQNNHSTFSGYLLFPL